MAKTTDTAKAQPPAQPVDDQAQLLRRIDALMSPAQKGDRKAMNELRPAMRAAWGEAWHDHLTSPADAVRLEQLETTMGDNLLVREAWERRAKALQRDLEGPAPTPLESILCERVALCWLDAQLVDLLLAVNGAPGKSIASGDYYSRRAERAQRRYLDAALALARVRRLLAPVVAQVNIAQPGAQQLNIASPAQPANATPVAAPGAPVAVVTSPTWPPAATKETQP